MENQISHENLEALLADLGVEKSLEGSEFLEVCQMTPSSRPDRDVGH
ncbi:MAG: hypothetical protein ACO3LE_10155 [Bdellovibrionota bacterium]